MLSVEEALARILAAVPVLGAESVELMAALNRVLAEPIISTRDLPPWANSAMDGYALRAEDTRPATAVAPVGLHLVGEVAAGAVLAGRVARGETCRILTGAPLPDGADAVIPQEEVQRRGEEILVARPVTEGQFVRPRGEDVRRGDTVLDRGRVLSPAALGVLAALSRPTVSVVQRPRVAILSTGDELVELGGTLAPGQIPNSNGYALCAQVLEAGGTPVNLGIARDTTDDLMDHLRRGLSADVIVSSAGVSVGDRDLVRATMEKLGVELDFWQVSMRPGKPLTFGRIGSRLVFGLPGNPVSSMVTFELFVRPALRRMSGHRDLARPRVRARAAAPIDNPGGRRGYLRVRLARDGEGITATPTGDQGSGILRSMLSADGLAVVPPDMRVETGQTVEVIVLDTSVLSGPEA